MKTLNISIPEGKTAEWINGVLTLVDENTADKRPIQERVRSYEDALAVLGEDAFPFDKVCPDMTKDEIAYIKLKTIVRSLNEGWVPELKEGEYRYYPWYYLYTQEELDNMEQNEKDKRKLLEFGGFCSAVLRLMVRLRASVMRIRMIRRRLRLRLSALAFA